MEECHAGSSLVLFGKAVADRDHDDDIPASNLLPSSVSDALGRFPSDYSSVSFLVGWPWCRAATKSHD